MWKLRGGLALVLVFSLGISQGQTVQIQIEVNQQLVQIRAQAGTGGFFSNRFYYLQQPIFQKELKLTQLQTEKLKLLNEKMQEIYKNPGSDRVAWSKKIQELQKNNENEVGKILQPEQVRRFRQVYLQQLGDSVFLDPEVVAILALSDSQKQAQTEIRADTGKMIVDLYRSAGGNFGDYAAFDRETRALTMKILAATLTPAQKKAFDDLLGAPLQK
ncbi:MAG: hypothetical protein EXR99_02510 [Gemmataceae bacterium]|nr:hypothetical protein [Gemmataceae bacterium]